MSEETWQPDGTGILFRVLRCEQGNIVGLNVEIDGEDYAEGYTVTEARQLESWLARWFGVAGGEGR